MSKKFDKIKDWLDTNEHIHKALVYMGLSITIFGLKDKFTGNFSFVPYAGFLMLILMFFQYFLGIREIK